MLLSAAARRRELDVLVTAGSDDGSKLPHRRARSVQSLHGFKGNPFCRFPLACGCRFKGPGGLVCALQAEVKAECLVKFADERRR